jgi:hypothetical protein
MGRRRIMASAHRGARPLQESIGRWVRRFARVLVVVAVAALAVPVAAWSTDGVTRTVIEYTPDNPTIDSNPCTSEPELLVGTIVILSHEVVDATGGSHIFGVAVFQNFTATGLTSGTVYREIEASPADFETTAGAEALTIVGRFQLIGPQGLTFVARVVMHVTVTPAGDFVVSFERGGLECV